MWLALSLASQTLLVCWSGDRVGWGKGSARVVFDAMPCEQSIHVYGTHE